MNVLRIYLFIFLNNQDLLICLQSFKQVNCNLCPIQAMLCETIEPAGAAIVPEPEPFDTDAWCLLQSPWTVTAAC